MATDTSRPLDGVNTPASTTTSLFQKLVSEKLDSLCVSSSSKRTAGPDTKADITTTTTTTTSRSEQLSRDVEMSEPQMSPGVAFISSAPYQFNFSMTPSEASSARRRAVSTLLPASPEPPRINPFENGYVDAAEHGTEDVAAAAATADDDNAAGDDNDKEDGEVSESEPEPEPEAEPEPAAKRLKRSPNPAPGPDCTCAISTTCARASATGVRDCRLALISIPKRTKPAANNKKTGLITTQFISKKKQMEIRRSNDEILDILNQFRKCQAAPKNDLPRIFQLMRDRIHHLHLYEIPSASVPVIKSRLLDSDTGLPAIIRNDQVPWDIRLDAEMYQMRLERDDIDPDIHRGLIVSRAIQEGTARKLSRSLDTNYRFKISAFFIGEGHLRVGQWFPYRICAIRDGAHGELEGGIAGRENLGAVSIILSSSGSTSYPDIDQGDTILYCGTKGKNGKVSLSTSFMLESSSKKNEIRVLRSAKLQKVNPYRPAEGIRYDGLYRITEHELLDQVSLLYRFTLKRIDGQHPIRYQGAEVRPTDREIKELKTLKEHVSFTKPTLSKKP